MKFQRFSPISYNIYDDARQTFHDILSSFIIVSKKNCIKSNTSTWNKEYHGGPNVLASTIYIYIYTFRFIIQNFQSDK